MTTFGNPDFFSLTKKQIDCPDDHTQCMEIPKNHFCAAIAAVCPLQQTTQCMEIPKNHFCLEVSGDFACFTRPEMKVERVSYDVMTPSSACAVFESILWKPAICWKMHKIEVLKPIRWISVRRNEVAAKIPARNVQTAMNTGYGSLALYIEDNRQQRAGLFLRDVAYRIHAEMIPVGGDALENPDKYREMFLRRAEKGQCVNQPYLGCREFAARFRLIHDLKQEPRPLPECRDLGWMLFDMDFSRIDQPQPRFFRAAMKAGVIDLAQVEVAA